MEQLFHRKDRTYEFWAMEQPHWVDNKIQTRYHREDGPARIITHKNGAIQYEWWQNGNPYRLNGPTTVNVFVDRVTWEWPKNAVYANMWMQMHGARFLDELCTLPPEYALLYTLRFQN